MSTKKYSSLMAAEQEIDYWEKLENHYRDLYNSQVESNNAAAAEATQKTLRQIGEQIDTLNAQFKESNSELYRGFRDAARKLPQQLAAAGITGGLSESSHVKLQTDYQDNVSRNERSLSGSVSALRRQGIEAENDNLSSAREKNQDALEAYQTQQLAIEKEKRSELEKEAAAMAKTGDFSLYSQLGYSQSQIAALRNNWEIENPQEAMLQAAQSRKYGAEAVSAMPATLAQYYLQGLGYGINVTGKWDNATEKAYQAAFGTKSGRK